MIADTLRRLGACPESIAYVTPHGNDAVAALAECVDRRWLTWLAGKLMIAGHLDRRVIVLCACASARTALQYVPAGEERPLRAIETAEAWCRGEATIEQVRETQRGAWAAASVSYAAAASASYAAAYASSVSYAAAASASYAAYASSASYVSYAAAWRSAREQAEAEQLALTKWMLGPALIDGLRRYESAVGGAP